MYFILIFMYYQGMKMNHLRVKVLDICLNVLIIKGKIIKLTGGSIRTVKYFAKKTLDLSVYLCFLYS